MFEQLLLGYSQPASPTDRPKRDEAEFQRFAGVGCCYFHFFGGDDFGDGFFRDGYQMTRSLWRSKVMIPRHGLPRDDWKMSQMLHGTEIFTYIWHRFMVNVGKSSIYGAYGNLRISKTVSPEQSEPPIPEKYGLSGRPYEVKMGLW